MSDLDALIKKSLANATPHTKKIYSKNPMTAEELIDFVNSKGLILAATVKPDRKPHLSPIDLNIVDEKFYIGIDEGTARHRNLRQNPSITIMMVEGWKRQAIVEGEARMVDMKSQAAAGVLDAQKKKYGWNTKMLAEVLPEKIFNWKRHSKSE